MCTKDVSLRQETKPSWPRSSASMGHHALATDLPTSNFRSLRQLVKFGRQQQQQHKRGILAFLPTQMTGGTTETEKGDVFPEVLASTRTLLE